jgi:hypothetical protein
VRRQPLAPQANPNGEIARHRTVRTGALATTQVRTGQGGHGPGLATVSAGPPVSPFAAVARQTNGNALGSLLASLRPW